MTKKTKITNAMEEEQRPITQVLQELIKSRGMTTDKLASKTDIPKRFIESLLRGDFDQLPAKPYVRGYLFKVAEVLEVDQHTLWQSYRHSADIAVSGERDYLPSNRFALKQIRTSRLVILFIVVVVLSFAGFRFNDVLGKPTIDLVDLPKSTSEGIIVVRGSVAPGDSLTLNGEVIYPNQSGEFEKEVQLQPLLNTLEFRIQRYLGREAKVMYQVFYQPNIQ